MGKSGKLPAEPAAPRSLRGVLESLFWTAAAGLVVLYGSGKNDLLAVLLHDRRVNRLFVLLGAINVVLNAALFSYVYVWLGFFRAVKDPARSGTLAVPAGAVTCVTTIVAFIAALWPVFGILSIAQVVVITYGLVSALSFVPGVGPLTVEDPRVGRHAAGSSRKKSS